MKSESQSSADSFVLYRILGNDLPPLHGLGQTLHNLRFILDREPPLPGLDKRWIVNRITDPEIETQVIALLDDRSQHFIRLDFDLDLYRTLQPDYSHFTEQDFDDFFAGRDFVDIDSDSKREYQKLLDHSLYKKNRYVTNVNAARNFALGDGRSRARWVLPWDGNCFLTETAWRMILEQTRQSRDVKYIIVPMERLNANDDVLNPDFNPAAQEEPQIIFRSDSIEEFDEELRYGRLSKVEMLRRLGVPGVWDNWDYQPWENREWTRSPEFGKWRRAGWVARLFSGERVFNGDPADDGFRRKSQVRRIAIRRFINKLDERALQRSLRPDRLLVYNENLLQLTKNARRKKDSDLSRLADSVITRAERALSTPFYSAVQKLSISPSGDPHDYFSPAPFWWPNPETSDGLPYVRRDGKRVPESELFSEESGKYDHSRLQTMFDSVTVLALAWRLTESIHYARHAAEMIRTWFLRPETRMNPHLRYSQIRNGHDYGGRGIIEAKDFYYFLDAVRLLQRSPAYPPSDHAGLFSWCEEYLCWLLTGEQGRSEARKKNNHGTCYDLQVAALCGFLGNYAGFVEASNRLKARLSNQFYSDGSQPYELDRTDPLHYCAFNLQSWFNLAFLAERAGVDLWNYPTRDGSILKKAFGWMFDREKWRSLQTSGFDESRLAPLLAAGVRRLGFQSGSFSYESSMEPRLCLHSYAGVPPYWPLVFGLTHSDYEEGF